jgi:exonuclease SbcC
VGRFKAATDALFAQREAAFHARDAELAAHLAERETLLARLEALGADATATEIKRTLAEVDRAWRQAGEVPRHAIAALEARLHDLHAALMQRLTDGVQQRWQAQCDTLAARLALCEEREDAGTPVDDLEPRWATAGALPATWQQALAQRWARAAGPGPLATPAVDDLLLQLEAALGMPASPEWQAARHQLKLRALKNALEGRGPTDRGPGRPDEWLLAVLRQAGLAAAQRARVRALVAALRQAPAGALGSATMET